MASFTMELASATINQQSKRPTQTIPTKDTGALCSVISLTWRRSQVRNVVYSCLFIGMKMLHVCSAVALTRELNVTVADVVIFICMFKHK